jgi:hypothetical protein
VYKKLNIHVISNVDIASALTDYVKMDMLKYKTLPFYTVNNVIIDSLLLYKCLTYY